MIAAFDRASATRSGDTAPHPGFEPLSPTGDHELACNDVEDLRREGGA